MHHHYNSIMASASNKRDESPCEKENGVYCPKRLRSLEPDVKVIVGKKTFHHYAALLCNESPYLDAMLSSNMKEGSSKVIEFPDKDPNEWEQVCKFFNEPSRATLEPENLSVLAPWFSELQMRGWLASCDKVLEVDIHEQRDEFDRLREGHCMLCDIRVTITELIKVVLDRLQVAVAYHLESSMNEGLAFLDLIFESCIYYLDPECIQKVITILKQEQAAWNRLWPNIRMHLPSHVRDFQAKDLVDNPLLEQVLHQKAELSFVEKHGEEVGITPAEPRYY